MDSLWSPLGALPSVAAPDDARAAVLAPLYEKAGRLHVILTRRPDDMRTHAGDVVFPGGTMDPSDGGPEGTALREAWEEIALPADHVEVIGGLTPIFTRESEMLVVPVVARVRRPARLIPQPGEVQAIIEPPLDDLLDEERWHTEDWVGHRVWFFEFPEGILWGATARMIRELLTYFR